MASDAFLPSLSARASRWLIWWQAFLAFTGYVAAAGVLSDLASPKVAAALLVINGGLNQATGVILSKSMSRAPTATVSDDH